MCGSRNRDERFSYARGSWLAADVLESNEQNAEREEDKTNHVQFCPRTPCLYHRAGVIALWRGSRQQLLDQLHQAVGPVFSSRERSQRKYRLRSLISQKIPHFLSSHLLGIAFVLNAPCVAPLSLGLTYGSPSISMGACHLLCSTSISRASPLANLVKCELAADGVGGRSATSGSITCRCGWIFRGRGVGSPSLTSGCTVRREETRAFN